MRTLIYERRASKRGPNFAAATGEQVSMTAFKAQTGFTLIELMMVVAIIGILASVAIPMLGQYTIRTRVTEGLVSAGTARTRVAEILQSGHATPAGYAAAFVAPAPTANVASVAINPLTGVVTMMTTSQAGGGSVVLSPYTGANTGLPNPTVPFPPPVGQVNWQCMAAGTPSVVVGVLPGTLPRRFAPPECR